MAFQDAIKRQQRDPAEILRQLAALREHLISERQRDRAILEAIKALNEKIDNSLDNARQALQAIRADVQAIKTKVGA